MAVICKSANTATMTGVWSAEVYCTSNLAIALTITLLITDSFINPTMGGFIAGNDSVCHTITVFEDTVVEPDGTIIVRISNSTLIPPNTMVNISEAEVTIVNDDCELKYKLTLYT